MARIRNQMTTFTLAFDRPVTGVDAVNLTGRKFNF